MTYRLLQDRRREDVFIVIHSRETPIRRWTLTADLASREDRAQDEIVTALARQFASGATIRI